MRVRWTRTALANLSDLASYIAQDNPHAATEMVDRILNAIESLKTHPALGKRGRVANSRELVASETPFITPYRVKAKSIEILRIFHAARRWPNDF